MEPGCDHWRLSPFERPFLVPRRASEQKMSLPVERDESEPDIWPLSAGHLPQGQQQPRAQILSWVSTGTPGPGTLPESAAEATSGARFPLRTFTAGYSPKRRGPPGTSGDSSPICFHPARLYISLPWVTDHHRPPLAASSDMASKLPDPCPSPGEPTKQKILFEIVRSQFPTILLLIPVDSLLLPH